MTPHATVKLVDHALEFRCLGADFLETRPFSDNDAAQLQQWAERHQALARSSQPGASGLLGLGRQLFTWLDCARLEGKASFLTCVLDTAPVPLLVEFVIGKSDDSTQARAFLDAPWELLADDTGHWAIDRAKGFCPIRRIGQAVAPLGPSPNRLGMVFMAAAPHGADNLDFEAEEVSILSCTKNTQVDLYVEESGTLDLLAAAVAREQPDVVQISCHGVLQPMLGLLLEDEVGDPFFAKASALISKLAVPQRRLLFLSACETAEAHPVLDSLARSLVNCGAPAVLGWAAPVLDIEATLFAGSIYERLAQGEDLAHALAHARLDLSDCERLPEPPRPGPRSRDWHLARLYLASNGGGVVATPGGKQRHLAQGHAAKTFLDAKGKQVPVASDLEFVGRRRQIQGILREFRALPNERHAGVLLHGVGRQGKSSLAARVARRLEHTHETVVIFGRYDAPFILRKLGDQLGTPAVTNLVEHHLPEVEADKSKLLAALTELLEGPCAQTGDGGAKPVLLVLDDFEQALSERDHRSIEPEYCESIRALLLAFRHATTESRLLFTCRYQFTCPHHGQNLADADHLLDVSLPRMNEREARKQAGAKLRVPEVASALARLPAAKLTDLRQQVDRIIANARGNPGLQDLLFTLAVNAPATCDRCLAEIEEFLNRGTLPTEDKIRAFLENLALESLIGLLTPVQRELLRAATLFELPVPVTVIEAMARTEFLSAVSQISNSQGGVHPEARGTVGRLAECDSAIQQTASVRY